MVAIYWDSTLPKLKEWCLFVKNWHFIHLLSLIWNQVPKIYPQTKFELDPMRTREVKIFTLSGPAFSVIHPAWRGAGGSEVRMPKIKLNINRLKWNFVWVIIAIKAFLMQDLRLIALLVLEIWRHKISFGRMEGVIKFGYLPPENGFKF